MLCENGAVLIVVGIVCGVVIYIEYDMLPLITS